jgi:phage terminase small subunit
MTNSQPKPPAHLSDEASAWWREVVDAFDLDDHHLRLLRLSAEAWDSCQTARRAIATHGQTYSDRFNQPRARPEIAIERDARLAFVRILRELGLDVSEPAETPRPPAIGGNAGRAR